MDQARVTLTGTFNDVSGSEAIGMAREAYLKKHPEAFWVDFGDFSYLRMDDLVCAQFVGGFGRISKVRHPSRPQCGLRWSLKALCLDSLCWCVVSSLFTVQAVPRWQ